MSGLWELITSEDGGVRCVAAECLAGLLREKAISTQVSTRRVLPALLTLSTDPSPPVRYHASLATMYLSTQITPIDLLQKLGSSLAASFQPTTLSFQGLRSCVVKMQPQFAVTYVMPLLESSVSMIASDAGRLSPLIPIVCDVIRSLVNHCHVDGAGLSLVKMISCLRCLSKSLSEPSLKGCVTGLLRECESFEDKDHKNTRFLAKFRELLEEPTTVSPPQPPQPAQPLVDPLEPLPHPSPKAVVDQSDQQSPTPQQPPLTKNKSLLSKAKMRFFGES
eukprot:TRINITY_DN2964_c0_g1_i1.p1 TRINITY_DN2964_c0_g1~~TRINITY_DN2964_c0_g1_i1.p1  ORF type:complete len:278 (+),score=54.22 TRINITY_DN2964_c0_g1_i1:3-836(+)